MPGLRFNSVGLTHVGLVRRRNEDAFLERAEAGLWVVADGMGGHEAGDVASAAIVAALQKVDPPDELDEVARRVSEGLTQVDVGLRGRAAELGPGAVIASTVVVLLTRGEQCAALWAGDSRLYRWRAGELRQLTTDHSKVQEMIDAGVLRPEHAARHPAGHIVTRAVGAGPVDIAVRRDAVQPGDRFLLCSDGLTNMLSDAEIAREMAASSPAAARRLLDLVLERGAIDNVTIVIVAAGSDA